MAALTISLAAEPVLALGSFVLTNSMLTSVVGSVLIIALFYLARATGLLEAGVEAMLNLIEDVTHDRAKALRFFPLLMTFFCFIVVNNWLGLVPGVGSIVVHTAAGTVPLFRGANADLNTTLALAIISVAMLHVYAISELGIVAHAKKYLSWNPIMLGVGFLELFSDLSKIISFAFRLFGNIFAGEVLLLVIAFLAPFVGPLPFYGLELFVGLVQALVFTMLTLVFLQISTSAHGHDEGSNLATAH